MSVRDETLFNLNDLFNPFAVKKSSLRVSNIMSKDSCDVNLDAVSNMILSAVTSESSSVPDSCRIPPPTTLTNASGNNTSASADGLVNDNVSPI